MQVKCFSFSNFYTFYFYPRNKTFYLNIHFDIRNKLSLEMCGVGLLNTDRHRQWAQCTLIVHRQCFTDFQWSLTPTALEHRWPIHQWPVMHWYSQCHWWCQGHWPHWHINIHVHRLYFISGTSWHLSHEIFEYVG